MKAASRLPDPSRQYLHTSDWLPGETLFSLCSREHVLSGARLSRITTLRLFGDSRLGAGHDVPARLEHFIQVTQGQYGTTAWQICREHTLLPFYLSWRTPEDQRQVIARVSGHCAGSVKSVLGLPASQFGAQHPLKLCPQCVQVDQATFGTAYWHLDHQLPAVWICPIHRCLLRQCRLKRLGVGRFLWCLPSVDESIPMEDDPAGVAASWVDFGHLVLEAVHELHATRIDYTRLHGVYVQALYERGLMKGSNSFCICEITKQYLVFLDGLHLNSKLGALPTTTMDCGHYLANVLYPGHVSRHPLRHLLFIHWLFGDWPSFWSAYNANRTQSNAHLSASTPQSAPSSATTIQALAIDLVAQGKSASEVARTCSVDVHTVQSWAAKAGIAVCVRRTALRSAIIKSLRQGRTKEWVARQHEVSIQTITRLLRSEVDLHAQWREALWQRARSQARTQWLRHRKSHPTSGNKQLRMLDPAIYAWLYRHDRQWLCENSAAHVSAPSNHDSRVNWQHRDALLVQQIQGALLTLRTTYGSDRLTHQALCQKVPTLFQYASKLDKLPLTRQLLERCLARRRTRSARP